MAEETENQSKGKFNAHICSFFHKPLRSSHVVVYLQQRYSLPWIKVLNSVCFFFLLGKPCWSLCWTRLQSCPEAKRAWRSLCPDREETAGTKAVTTLDNFLHGECVLLASKYHEELDEKGEYLSQDIWKLKYPGFGYIKCLVWGKLWSTYCWLVSANKWSRLYETWIKLQLFPCLMFSTRKQTSMKGPDPIFSALPWCDRIQTRKGSNIKIKRWQKDQRGRVVIFKKPKEQMCKISLGVPQFMTKKVGT